jgi:hypothetical protein
MTSGCTGESSEADDSMLPSKAISTMSLDNPFLPVAARAMPVFSVRVRTGRASTSKTPK